jgi:enamine deaminase RidA (YjgF/YER057c/UK114 family)
MLTRKYIHIESLEESDRVVNELPFDCAVCATAFVNALGNPDFFHQRESLLSFFDRYYKGLPVSVIAQSAAAGIVLEIWKLAPGSNAAYRQKNGVNYTVYEDETGKSLWGFGCTFPDGAAPFKAQACHAFDLMQAILSEEGFSMDNLIRQWNYIPSILKTEAVNGCLYQNYQMFNDIRQDYYSRYKTEKNYPAATGIGMDYGTVTIDFAALKPNEHAWVAGLCNPNQTNAYHYRQATLVGTPLNGNGQKKPPLFERAKYAGLPDKGMVFISGTAAISGEKTVEVNDPVRQTIVTVDNISRLVSDGNLQSNGIFASSKQYAGLRIYVKNEKDRDVIQKVCETYYDNIPVLCVKADICRDDLLVEIEGEVAVSGCKNVDCH